MKTICIMCPIGCELDVSKTATGLKVAGNACARGVTYGTQEYTKPERMVTTIKALKDGSGTVSLKTERGINKELIQKLLLLINKTPLPDNIQPGDKFITDALRSGVAVVVTGINKI